MKLGIFTQYVEGDCVERVAEKIAGYGLRSVILDTYPGMAIDLFEPSSIDCRRIRNAFDNAGLEIAGVGGYQNLAHPNPKGRADVYKRMSGLVKLCERIGSPMLCTETGSYNPNGYDWDPSNETEQALRQVAAHMRPLLAESRARGVTIALEPYVMTVTGSTRRLARLVDMIGSEGVKVIFDPAGILSRVTLGEQETFIRESFSVVASYLGLVHVQDCSPANDIKQHFNWQCAGTGMVDYRLFMDLVAGSGYDGHLILEFLREDQILDAVAFVTKQFDDAWARADRSITG